MIRKINSFGRALAVLSILESNEELSYTTETAFVEAYQNGREQGILIWGFDDCTAFYVAEARRSDQMVAYVGSYAMQSISDDAYRHPNYFSTVDEAAEWLANAIKEKLLNQATRRHAAAEEAASNG